jgi:hypothetical protein
MCKGKLCKHGSISESLSHESEGTVVPVLN